MHRLYADIHGEQTGDSIGLQGRGELVGEAREAGREWVRSGKGEGSEWGSCRVISEWEEEDEGDEWRI